MDIRRASKNNLARNIDNLVKILDFLREMVYNVLVLKNQHFCES